MTKQNRLQQKMSPRQRKIPALLGFVLFFSLLLVGGAFAASVTYEAEDASLSGVTVASVYAGYTGTGYADYGILNGDFIEWTVTATATGTATLDFRYANGSGTDLPLELTVNGTVTNPSLSFVPTTDWATWGTVSVSASLNAGSNTIRLTSIVNDGPNVDNLIVTEPNPPTPTPTTVVFDIPHGDYLAHTDRCAACHRTHTGQSEKLLYSSPGGNEFCYACHDGTGAQLAMVSTHGNVDFGPSFEANFTLQCVQCHNPHGTLNLADIKTDIVIVPGLSPLTDGPVAFSSLTGASSFDDGASPYNTRLCTVCHNNTNNPGYPMSNHLGGANHLGGYDLTGQDCTECHPHSADNTLTNSDGFMPVKGCTMCHAVAQDNGDGLPVGGRRAVTPEFGNSSHHVVGVQVTDNDCVACHYTADHTSGYVKLYDADNPATVITLNADPRVSQTEANKLEAFCLACHDADGAGGFAPFSNGSMPPIVDSALWNAGSHKTSGSSTCFDCHDNGHGSNKIKLMAPYNAVSDGSPDDPLRQEERFCYLCHDGSVAATNIQTDFGLASHHNVSDTDQADGSKVECANCHNPHIVNAGAKLSDPDNGSPWGGAMTDFCLVCHDGAPPAGVTFAGGGGGNAISTHSNIDVTAVEANFTTSCEQCHDKHGSDNLALVERQIIVNAPTTVGPVFFTARTGADSFDDGTNSGVCVICHIDAANPGFPMSNHTGGSGHSGGMDFTSSDCVQCHPHSVDTVSSTLDGFMPDPTCVGCHQFPMGPRRQIVGAGGDFSNTSHHVQGAPQDSDCEICHEMTQHQAGTVRLFNVDTGAVIPYTGGTIPEVFCTACHDANGANGNTAPYSDGVTVPDIAAGWGTSSHAVGLTCYDCHDNGHGSNKIGLLSAWNAVPDGDPNDPLRQEERFCYQCHDGSVAATDLQTEFSKATHHDVALTEQTANGNGSKVECINCHNPHMDTATNQNVSPDDWYQQWTGRRVDFCLACHDGAPPIVTNGPAPAVSMPASWNGTGYDKSSYTSSTHDANLSAWGCSHCHDEHGSNELSMLVANYTIADFTPYTYGSNDYAICWVCHIEDDIVRTAGGNKANNAFRDRHDKHVSSVNTPCMHCHDAHSPFDAGEEGLIDFVYGVNKMDITFLGGRNNSTAFWITGNTGYCYLACHDPADNKNHTPKDYSRNNNLTSSTDCTVCHPGGPPPP